MNRVRDTTTDSLPMGYARGPWLNTSVQALLPWRAVAAA
jgi:hypothetical protein